MKDNKEKKSIAVVLVSGGMDSCVTASLAGREKNLALMHVNYGQKTQRKEEELFLKLVEFYKPECFLSIDLPFFKTIGGSSLTDRNIPVSDSDPGILGIPSSYVPFRNANLLAAAVSWAEVIGADSVFIGAVEEDSSGYPDCRKSFYNAFQNVIKEGTKPETDIRIYTPVIGMKKGEIVRLGEELKAPFHLTWSCYRNENAACGKCDSCMLRLKAFRDAGVEDPVPYAKN